MRPARTRLTLAAAEHAFDEWGANCGPGAIAGVLGLTLDELRPHLLDFERRRYTNPTLMRQILDGLGVKYQWHVGQQWPMYGLIRIQWEGPWTKPGVPIAARYRQTHWIGGCMQTGGEPGDDRYGVFDINCLNNGSGWVSLKNWREQIVPHLLEGYPKASGAWHVTHSAEMGHWGELVEALRARQEGIR